LAGTDGNEKYLDSFWYDFCEKAPIKDWCQTCPEYCRIDINELIEPSSGKCAEAPEHNPSTGIMTPSNYDNCKRCPISCRFVNPSSKSKL
jgi:hypothetical protein